MKFLLAVCKYRCPFQFINTKFIERNVSLLTICQLNNNHTLVFIFTLNFYLPLNTSALRTVVFDCHSLSTTLVCRLCTLPFVTLIRLIPSVFANQFLAETILSLEKMCCKYLQTNDQCWLHFTSEYSCQRETLSNSVKYWTKYSRYKSV